MLLSTGAGTFYSPYFSAIGTLPLGGPISSGSLMKYLSSAGFGCVLALLGGAARAQSSPAVTGQLIDAQSRQPVPYASVATLTPSAGTLADSSGYFKLTPSAGARADSLLITAPGYQRQAVLLGPDANHTRAIELPRLRPLLASTHPLGQGSLKVMRLGAGAQKPGVGMIMGQKGSQYALFMGNEQHQKWGYVRSVSFYIGESGQPNRPFRVRLYKADGINNAPGSDLVHENLVVTAPAGGAWFTVDLQAYTVLTPQEGFYVAMEWLVDAVNPTFPTGQPSLSQVLRPSYEFKEARTWNYTWGRGWSVIKIPIGPNLYNAMIRAEVEVLK